MALKNTADGQSLQTADVYSLNTTPLSFCCWANLISNKDYATLFGATQNSSHYFVVYIRSGSGESYYPCIFEDWGSGSSRLDRGTTALTAGQWYFIAATRAAGVSQARAMYVCPQGGTWGASSGTGPGGTIGTLTDFTIFDNTAFSGENSNSIQAHVKVWNAVLSEAELMREMRSFRPARTSNLVYWNSLQSIDTRLHNYAAGGWKITATGTLSRDKDPQLDLIDVPRGYTRNGSSLILLPNMNGAELHIAPGAVSGDIEQALSGQAATASAGTLTPSHSKDLTGQAATASAGTLAPSHSQALTGSAVTASAGTLVGSKTVALTGQAVTASAGTLAPSHSQALSGQEVTASAGTIIYTAGVAVALTGSSVTAEAGTLAPSHSQPLTGQAASASAGTITYTSETLLELALTGQAVTSTAGALTPSHSQALTGQAATAEAGTLAPAHSQALTGQAATAAAGTVSYSGSTVVNVALTGEAVTASAGTIGTEHAQALTGQAASASAGTLSYTSETLLELALTGQSVTSTAGTLVPSATVALSGQAANAEAGTLAPAHTQALTGSAASAAAGSLIYVPGITIALTGQAVTATAGSLSPGAALLLAGSGIVVSAGTMTISGTEPVLRYAPDAHTIVGAARVRENEAAERARLLSGQARVRTYLGTN